MKEIIYVDAIWLDELEAKVNEKIKEGYIPSEHLIIREGTNYIQAMVKL